MRIKNKGFVDRVLATVILATITLLLTILADIVINFSHNSLFILFCIVILISLQILIFNLNYSEISNYEQTLSILIDHPFVAKSWKKTFEMPFTHIIFVDVIRMRWWSTIVVCYKYPIGGKINIVKFRIWGLRLSDGRNFKNSCIRIIKNNDN